MKKAIILVVSFLFVLTPVLAAQASNFVEIPPIVKIDGIDETEYDINKLIEDNRVVVSLKKKNSDVSYSWSFDKDKVGEVLELNFELNFESPKAAEINEMSIENTDKMYLSFQHHGALPSEATLRVNVSKSYVDGTKLYLYYYNEEKKQIEYIDNGLEVVDGHVEFKINHCSEYFLTAAIVNDAANNPKSMNTIIIVLVGVIVVLVGATIFSTKK